ncbi:hypothetical protein DRO61_00950 [Candidatus Bathyarchaeota archaeon]|nr:MAG: hypothetical protein DRO61_00950 [Candidatus Bathyarchaeota archaeon]
MSQSKIGMCVAFCTRLKKHNGFQIDGGPKSYYRTTFLDCVKKQIEFIDSYSEIISRIVFVVKTNDPVDEDFNKAVKLVEYQNQKDNNREWLIFRLDNDKFISYGSWDWAIKNKLYDLDYVFLLEDDYIPVSYGYDKVLMECILNHQDSTKIVKAVSHWGHGTNTNRNHAMVSNGIVNVDLFLKKGGFYLVPLKAKLQRRYLKDYDNHRNSDFKILNLSEYYMCLYFHSRESKGKSGIKIYGNLNSQPLIVPIELLFHMNGDYHIEKYRDHHRLCFSKTNLVDYADERRRVRKEIK